MTAHRLAYDGLLADWKILDPGDTGNIVASKDRGYVPLISAAAETRTLKDPLRVGIRLTLFCNTYVGDITVTADSQVDNAGSLTLIFGAQGEWVELLAVDEGASFSSTDLQWRVVGGEGVGGALLADAADISVADAGSLITATQVEAALQELAEAHQNLDTTAGVGITVAADSFTSGVTQVGTIFHTVFVIEIDGLNSGGAAEDIIGDDGTGAAYLGQITAARNGTIFAGRMMCLEVPTGGDPDVDLWTANEATGVEDTGIAALTGEVQLTNGGDWTLALVRALTAFPPANDHLYLTCGAITDATYTAGIFIIELWGK